MRKLVDNGQRELPMSMRRMTSLKRTNVTDECEYSKLNLPLTRSPLIITVPKLVGRYLPLYW
jgi:hypothetical protein